MIAIVSQQFSIVTQLSFNLTPKQWSSELPKPDEKPLIADLFLMIVSNYRTISIPNNSLSLVYPIVVAKAKPQPKDQIWVLSIF